MWMVMAGGDLTCMCRTDRFYTHPSRELAPLHSLLHTIFKTFREEPMQLHLDEAASERALQVYEQCDALHCTFAAGVCLFVCPHCDW